MKKKPSTDEAPAKVESKINPALEPLTRLTSTLKLDERNARKHERRSVDTIKASLSTYGQQKPIVALTDGTVIAGNGTLEAARELGWERIAVVTFDTEDEARARAFAIMDNRSAELSSWDFDSLFSSLRTVGDYATGFSSEEIDGLIAHLTPPSKDPDEIGKYVAEDDFFVVKIDNVKPADKDKIVDAVTKALTGTGYVCNAF